MINFGRTLFIVLFTVAITIFLTEYVDKLNNSIPNNDHIICFTPGIDGDNKPLLDIFTQGPATFEAGIWKFKANVPRLGEKMLRTNTQCLVIKDVVPEALEEAQPSAAPTIKP